MTFAPAFRAEEMLIIFLSFQFVLILSHMVQGRSYAFILFIQDPFECFTSIYSCVFLAASFLQFP